MDKKVFVVALSILIFITLQQVRGDLEPILQRCCASGEAWSRNHTSCTGPGDVAGIPPQDRLTCLTTLYICCIRTHRQVHCESGKDAARTRRPCTALQDHGAETFKDCCDGCTLGLRAESMQMPCSFTRFSFGSPWDEAFRDCCQNPYSALGTSPQLGNGKCATDNPCDQKCEEIGQQVRCSCYPGYKLSANLKTCEDIDECLLEAHNCDPATEICINSIGGFQCLEKPTVQRPDVPVATCPVGYEFNRDKRTCDDVDECLLGACPRGLNCINTKGSFRCIPGNSTDGDLLIQPCPRGFQLHSVSGRCIDVDECSEETDTCDRNLQICQNSHGSYQCLDKPNRNRNCPAGFKWNENKDNCEGFQDIPGDCLTGVTKCEANQVCMSIDGVGRCVQKSVGDLCDPGFKPDIASDGVTGICTDVNECEEFPDVCDIQKEKCQNEWGRYECIPLQTTGPSQTPCPPGFELDPRRRQCVDVNECIQRLDQCDLTTQECVNTNGSYECIDSQRPPTPEPQQQCPPGYRPRNGACEDVNECLEGRHRCLPDKEQCQNVPGAYRCQQITVNPPPVSRSCPTGRRFDPATGSCEDINECTENSHDCDRRSQVCVNTQGSFQCQTRPGQPASNCGTGYVYDPTREICADLNECGVIRPCKSDQVCENTPGSYKCVCAQGYALDTFTRECKDVNECQLQLHACAESQRCDNTIGSYTCVRTTSCGTGYTLNAALSQCEDDDECLLGTHNCGAGFACRNTLGSFRCDRVKCPAGQKLLTDGSCKVVVCGTGMEHDNDGNCIDINECARNSACRLNQRCINTVGSYRCQNLLNCGAGFELNDVGDQCVDVDECARRIAECGAGQTCRNRQGGYVCECPRGYSLSNQRVCEDIDECQEQNVCNDDKAVCLNTRGGYKCNRIECPPNYVRDKDHRNRCKRSSRDCVQGSAECLKDPLSYSYNYITFVSKMRLPLSGQLDLFTMRGPRFQSTTVQFSLELKDARAPQGTPPATKEFFHLRRTNYNEAMISLIKTIQGPQEIELDLIMKIYHNGLFGGTAVAKIYIFVTEYEF
ncbi:uncharacterized protein TNIN_270692 [Trichonephila inaurata madagascariensis]|uniref:Fibulin-1 n=1 Tax=Trichonephila inaurata madagascariensis TaxID=2747483 RepID=A0A8X6WPR0_9ARAC|nr:uncharacterized protein TNIN_270692 [Trichonephila inaurata madagascariensis]